MGIRDKHTNPCEDVKLYPERKRERFLSPAELHKLGRVLVQSEADGTENSYAIAAFRLLLLTGCRLSEIQKLRWQHVDLDQAQINLPDSKTGKRAIHLGSAAVDLLANLPRANGQPLCYYRQGQGAASDRPPTAMATDSQSSWA